MLNITTQTMTGRIRLARLLKYPEITIERYDQRKMLLEKWEKQTGEFVEEVLPGHEMETAKWLQRIPDLTALFQALQNCKVHLHDINDHINWDQTQKKLIQDLKQHLPYLWSLNGTEELTTYLSAYAGAESSDAESLFLNLDRECLISGIKKYAKRYGHQIIRIHGLFRMLPYFSRPEYIFHAMQSLDWYDVSRFLSKMAKDELQLIGAQAKTSWILSRYTTKFDNLVRESLKNKEAANYLSGLSRFMDGHLSSLERGTLYDQISGTLRQMTDASLCLSILEPLRNQKEAFVRTALLMSYCGYKPKLLRVMRRKMKTDAAVCSQLLHDTPNNTMAVAWFLGREDVLELQKTGWWKQEFDPENDWNEWYFNPEGGWNGQCYRLDQILINAMLRNENVFLKALAEDENMYHTLEYLADHKDMPINTNLFSKKQLKELVKEDMLSQIRIPDWMKEEVVTFDTVKALKKIKNLLNENLELSNIYKAFINIFRILLDECRMEEACRRMIQLLNAATVQEQKEILECGTLLATQLQKYDLYTWSGKLLQFQASGNLMIRILVNPDIWEICRDAENDTDLLFILRNKDRISECHNRLDELKQHFCDHDPYIMEIREFLDLEPEFYEKYRKETETFFIQNTEIVRTYLHNYKFTEYRDLKEKYRLILKAALCGKLNALKFHDGDLDREIGAKLAPEVIQEWETDQQTQLKNRRICEDSSFAGIMTLGEQPYHTCMSYINGRYAHCLLSYFDANKKIVYLKAENGSVIARAVMRLTKATNASEHVRQTLSFVDVEAEAATTEMETEYPVLFLEHMYTGCQDEMREKLEQDMIQFAYEKAKSMHVKLVVSNKYTSCKDLEKERTGIYITRSKSGYQYLDSFNGMHQNGNDDHYEYSHCYIKE